LQDPNLKSHEDDRGKGDKIH